MGGSTTDVLLDIWVVDADGDAGPELVGYRGLIRSIGKDFRSLVSNEDRRRWTNIQCKSTTLGIEKCRVLTWLGVKI